jgi:hypothetical protein
LLKVVREYAQERGGLLSQGERFAELEEEACQLGDALAAGLIEMRLEEQAARAGATATAYCPSCRRPARAREPEPRLAPTRRGEVTWQEPTYYCDRCRKSFFPQSNILSLDPDHTVSPGVLKKMVYAGSNSASFEQASRDLAARAELSISAQRIMRATWRLGQARLQARAEAVTRYQQLPLPEQQRSPRDHVPEVACVQVDGGRIQIRERRGEETAKAGFWRETKVACLLRMHSERHASNPCPTLPESFANLARMAE